MIQIIIKQKVNPQAPLDPRKYYGIAKSSGEVDIRQISKQISKETTLGTPDVIAVIEALLQNIPEYLLDGKIVKLGDLGSYRLTVSGQGADTIEEYSTNLIQKINLRFRPGGIFKNVLNGAKLQKVS